MALPELRGEGRLLTDPRHGTGKNDKPWASALIKFPQWRKTDDGWEEGDDTVASVIAFADLAGALRGFSKGDLVGIHGTAKAAVWKDKPQIEVIASQCWAPEKTKAPRKPYEPATT